MSDRNRGLFAKFDVQRTDGRHLPGEKHDGCRYFVLDATHDPFAVPALEAYQKACHLEYPALGFDLLEMIHEARLRAKASS